MIRRPPRSTLFPTRRSSDLGCEPVHGPVCQADAFVLVLEGQDRQHGAEDFLVHDLHPRLRDRKSTRLNSSHQIISYAVFCLKKKRKATKNQQNTYYANSIAD